MVDKPDTTNSCNIVETAVHTGGSTYYCTVHGCVMSTGADVPIPVVCDCAKETTDDA